MGRNLLKVKIKQKYIHVRKIFFLLRKRVEPFFGSAKRETLKEKLEMSKKCVLHFKI